MSSPVQNPEDAFALRVVEIRALLGVRPFD